MFSLSPSWRPNCIVSRNRELAYIGHKLLFRLSVGFLAVIQPISLSDLLDFYA